MAFLGDLEIVDDYNIRKEIWQDDWVPYEGGLEGSDYTVLRFRPVKTNGWYHCNKFEFELNS
jgi:general stress protein 26